MKSRTKNLIVISLLSLAVLSGCSSHFWEGMVGGETFVARKQRLAREKGDGQ